MQGFEHLLIPQRGVSPVPIPHTSLRRSRSLLPPEHSRNPGGHAEHNHRNLDEFHRQECEHAALGMQLPRGYGEENKVNDKLGQNAEHAPLPRAIEKSNAPGADEHPDVVRVNEREHQNVGFALVVRAVAAPAGTLVEELLPCVHRSGFDHGILVEIVADLGVWNFHHLVDEHVVVAA